MQMIRCAACGKHYDYLQEGCCPRCGAYNRPPRREWVEADGSIRHGDGSAQPRPGKVCYEKKVCHEEKQCFEGQARKPRKKPAAQPAVKNVHIPFKARRTNGNAQPNSVGIAVLGIVLFFIIIFIKNSGLLDNNWDHSDWDNTDWSDSDWDSEPATPDVDYFNIEASCGDEIRISDDLTIQFLGYIADEDGRVYLFYWATDDDLATDLLKSGFVMLLDGEEAKGAPDDRLGDGYIVFNTFSPSVQWKIFRINDSYVGNLTVSDLYPLEDDSLMDWVDPADRSST